MIKQIIIVRKDLNMRKGKIAAQVSHASAMFMVNQIRNTNTDNVDPIEHRLGNIYSVNLSLSEEQLQWIKSDYSKVVVGVESELELLRIIDDAHSEGLIVNHIVDMGKTEFNGVPTLTCAAIGPHDSEKIDKITKHLKLI